MKTFIFTVAVLLIFSAQAKTTSASTLARGFSGGTVGITLTYGDQKFEVPGDVVASWEVLTKMPEPQLLTNPASEPESLMAKSVGLPASPQNNLQFSHFDSGAVYKYLTEIAKTLNKLSVEPKITIDNNRVTDFSGPEDGLQLDQYKSTLDIVAALEKGLEQISLNISVTKPTQSLAALNNLGINELVAQGQSNFSGSPKNRRFNIAAGVEKMKGILVAPGQEFSFNDNLGPVDGEHGFLPELVIKGNNTIPEFGGGLCQVSTTTFRAAMAAGLPITARRNHAYAVQYYSPQGTDATIYPGSADLKFINNTPAYILIWPHQKDKDNLVFDFYGTKDDRQVTLQKPVVYDRQADGAMKASWTRIVTLDGQTSTSTFKSVYQAPALFHHDTQFVSATGTPTSEPVSPKVN